MTDYLLFNLIAAYIASLTGRVTLSIIFVVIAAAIFAYGLWVTRQHNSVLRLNFGLQEEWPIYAIIEQDQLVKASADPISSNVIAMAQTYNEAKQYAEILMKEHEKRPLVLAPVRVRSWALPYRLD